MLPVQPRVQKWYRELDWYRWKEPEPYERIQPQNQHVIVPQYPNLLKSDVPGFENLKCLETRNLDIGPNETGRPASMKWDVTKSFQRKMDFTSNPGSNFGNSNHWTHEISKHCQNEWFIDNGGDSTMWLAWCAKRSYWKFKISKNFINLLLHHIPHIFDKCACYYEWNEL